MEMIKKIVRPFYYSIKKIILKYNKRVILGKNVKVSKQTKFGTNIQIYSDVDIRNSFVDNFSYICSNSCIQNTYIGKFTCIAKNVSVIIGNHPSRNFVSTHPAFYSTQKQSGMSFVKENKYLEYKYAKDGYSVYIGNDVWIGQNVLILEGCSIGNGAIIGAGSIVTKDVPPYAIVVGLPARIIRYRFKEKEIDYLLEDQWWNKSIEWIINNKDYFLNINEYIKKAK